MKKKKKIRIKNLLILMLEHIEEAFNQPIAPADGICLISGYLCFDKLIITVKEVYEINIFLDKHLPKTRKGSEYCWKVGKLKPRIKWLKKQIKKLS